MRKITLTNQQKLNHATIENEIKNTDEGVAIIINPERDPISGYSGRIVSEGKLLDTLRKEKEGSLFFYSIINCENCKQLFSDYLNKIPFSEIKAQTVKGEPTTYEIDCNKCEK